MPSGIAPMASPCNPRPTTMGNNVSLSAQMIDPPVRSNSESSNIKRLPNMSPSRPAIGVITAPANKVTVITHEASAALVLSMMGRLGMRGTTMVCMSETTIPTNAKTQIMSDPPRALPLFAVVSVLETVFDRLMVVLLNVCWREFMPLLGEPIVPQAIPADAMLTQQCTRSEGLCIIHKVSMLCSAIRFSHGPTLDHSHASLKAAPP